ncbi:MAG: DUF4167 domain-containing protein [Proteobacteria bacterium]|nr:DUF4167 domain-containing protein [Pseudomonadota bacterium]
MRPGQGNRRPRRNGGGHPHSHGHGHGHPSQHSQHSQSRPRSAMQLRNQIFDSNGPEIRVRGNAFQVHEKYLGLAKDALSSGDRVLAENYLQHAEHYFRIIEAINEAAAAEQQVRAQQPGYMPQQPMQPGMQPPIGQQQGQGQGGQQQGNSFYNSMGDMGQQGGGAQTTPLNNLRSGPVTMETVAEGQNQGGQEGEEEDLSTLPSGIQASAGRR